MNEHQLRQRLRAVIDDDDAIEAALDEHADSAHDEARDRELDEQFNGEPT
jgi:hypothetical protein